MVRLKMWVKVITRLPYELYDCKLECSLIRTKQIAGIESRMLDRVYSTNIIHLYFIYYGMKLKNTPCHVSIMCCFFGSSHCRVQEDH